MSLKELRSLLTPFKKRTLRGRLYSFLQLALLAVKAIIYIHKLTRSIWEYSSFWFIDENTLLTKRKAKGLMSLCMKIIYFKRKDILLLSNR